METSQNFIKHYTSLKKYIMLLKTVATIIQSVNTLQFNNITKISSETTLINNIMLKLIEMFKQESKNHLSDNQKT